MAAKDAQLVTACVSLAVNLALQQSQRVQIRNFSVLCAEINDATTVPAVHSRPRKVSGTENLWAVHV